jgi:peptidoglycan hydrolase CwlO-like protein
MYFLIGILIGIVSIMAFKFITLVEAYNRLNQTLKIDKIDKTVYNKIINQLNQSAQNDLLKIDNLTVQNDKLDSMLEKSENQIRELQGEISNLETNRLALQQRIKRLKAKLNK